MSVWENSDRRDVATRPTAVAVRMRRQLRSRTSYRQLLMIAIVLAISLGLAAFSFSRQEPGSSGVNFVDGRNVNVTSDAKADVQETFTVPGLSFSVPESWTVTKADIQFHYEHLLVYVGTGSAQITCGDDFLPGLGGHCDEQSANGPNGVVVRVSALSWPPSKDSELDRFFSAGDPTARRRVIGGLAAVESELPPVQETYGSQKVMVFTLTRPGYDNGTFSLIAYFSGPDTDKSQSEMETLLASVKLSAPLSPESFKSN